MATAVDTTNKVQDATLATHARDIETVNKEVVNVNARIDNVNEKQAGLVARDEHLFKQQEEARKQLMAADEAIQADVATKVSATTFTADQVRQDAATAAVANAQVANTGVANTNVRIDNVVKGQAVRDQDQDDAIAHVGKGANTYTDARVTEVKNFNTEYVNNNMTAAREDFAQRMQAAANAQASRDATQDQTINDARAVADHASAVAANNSQRLDAVEGDIRGLKKDIEGVKRGMSGLAAIQGIPENTRALDNNVVGFGLGQYSDSTAIAAGITHHFNDHVVGKVGVGVPVQDFKQSVVNAGVAFGF